ncbi:MAG: hypothetical protein EPO25_18130 [Gammaproteobacteria bacterium]|nr:MAG: hypothetical protein EPO25_18130 [Gammaproteobacteria bacterium]
MTIPLCPHLAPVLAELLHQGSTIVGSARMAWSKVDLEVSLDRGPELRDLPAQPDTGGGLHTWTNTDPHYPPVHGLVCPACRQSLSWPRIP